MHGSRPGDHSSNTFLAQQLVKSLDKCNKNYSDLLCLQNKLKSAICTHFELQPCHLFCAGELKHAVVVSLQRWKPI